MGPQPETSNDRLYARWGCSRPPARTGIRQRGREGEKEREGKAKRDAIDDWVLGMFAYGGRSPARVGLSVPRLGLRAHGSGLEAQG